MSSFGYGSNPAVGKKAARRQRGRQVICTCGAQTFENHHASHLTGHRHKTWLKRVTNRK